MSYFPSAREAARVLGVPLLLREELDPRAFRRHDSLGALAVPAASAARMYVLAFDEMGRAGGGAMGAGPGAGVLVPTGAVWVTGPWGSLGHLPWAVGLADHLARTRGRAGLIEREPNGPLRTLARLGRRIPVRLPLAEALLGERVDAVNTDLQGVSIVLRGGREDRVEGGTTNAAAGDFPLVLADGLPESLEGPYPGADCVAGVILVASFRDHSRCELDTVVRRLRETGHRLLGLAAIGPDVSETDEATAVRLEGEAEPALPVQDSSRAKPEAQRAGVDASPAEVAASPVEADAAPAEAAAVAAPVETVAASVEVDAAPAEAVAAAAPVGADAASAQADAVPAQVDIALAQAAAAPAHAEAAPVLAETPRAAASPEIWAEDVLPATGRIHLSRPVATQPPIGSAPMPLPPPVRSPASDRESRPVPAPLPGPTSGRMPESSPEAGLEIGLGGPSAGRHDPATVSLLSTWDRRTIGRSRQRRRAGGIVTLIFLIGTAASFYWVFLRPHLRSPSWPSMFRGLRAWLPVERTSPHGEAAPGAADSLAPPAESTGNAPAWTGAAAESTETEAGSTGTAAVTGRVASDSGQPPGEESGNGLRQPLSGPGADVPDSFGAWAAPPPAGAGNRFVIHLTSFKFAAEAEGEVAMRRARGIDARSIRVEIPDRGTWYRIVTGNFATFAEAESVALRLQAEGRIPYAHIAADGGRGQPVPVGTLDRARP